LETRLLFTALACSYRGGERTIEPTVGGAALTGRTVVVTGGSMGLGLACASEIVRRGGAVVLCARGESTLEDARAELSREAPGRVHALAGDVTDTGFIERLLDAAESVGGSVSTVHAAAVLSAIGPVVEVDPARWWETVRVNLLGAFLVARATCRRLVHRGVEGSIVLFSGGGATAAFPNYTAYACGKVGVVRLAETLAQEMAPHRIRVNCVAPGFVATRMHDATIEAGAAAGSEYLRRTEQELRAGGVPPELAARTVAFLLSDAAEGISGRLVAAVHDEWARWPEHRAELEGSDLFTLRRIVPRDRGFDWQ
jgi:NAD(P)-dependent dehydrogenase (short-subunit alcohol dehydrogenase family)